MSLISSIIAELIEKHKHSIGGRREATHHRMLFPAPAEKSENKLIGTKVKRTKEAYDFHGSIIGNHSSSSPGMCCLG